MRKLLGFSLLVITLLIGIPDFSIADPLDNWHWRNPLPQGNTLNGIVYGNGTFVAVGDYGTTLTSPDGVSWTVRTSGTSNLLYGVAYGNGTFVAVGGGTILTSPDGVSWTLRISGTSNDLFGAAYGNSIFVAVGENGTLLTSPDGMIWTERASGTSNHLYGVAYGNGTFVAIGYGVLLTSPDGVSWTGRTSGSPSPLSGVAYGNGTFVAVGGGGIIVTSPDGVSWTVRASGTSGYLSGVAYGNGTFVAVSDVGPILTSPDGVSWTLRTSGLSYGLSAVAYGNGTFVAVSGLGPIVTSPDGVSWTLRTSGTSNDLFGAAYGNSIFVAVGENGTLLTSPDGMIWTERASGTSNLLYGVAYGNGTFVAVGGGGIIVTSPDGVSLTVRASGTSGYLYGVAYGNGTFVAVGDVGPILTSPDGVSWTLRTSGLSYGLSAVAYGNGTFVAVSGLGPIVTSPDGVSWTLRTSGPFSIGLLGVAYGNGTFVTVGQGTISRNRCILTSPDGVSWTIRTSGTSSDLHGIVYGNGTFVAVGQGGTILTSLDGVTWTKRTPWTSNYLYGVTYAYGTFVAVGSNGTILQSDPVITDIPHIYVNPASLNFEEVIVGNTSDKQVTVRNDGNANLIVGTITSPSLPFSKIVDDCSGQTFAPGASCTVTYRFSPTSAGTFSSNSNIPSNDPDNNPVTVSLNGVGTTSAIGVIDLPQTGQTKCYNASGTEIPCSGTGQDGESQAGVEWPDPRFTVSGDCVTDNLTGLIWTKNGNLPNGTRTWQGALDYVASINSGSGLCGHKDWRLPNFNELESLINSGEAFTANWLNSQGFSNVQSYYYWSSTTFAYFEETVYPWVVRMWDGSVDYGAKSSSFYVWPVRSGQLNNPDPLYPANVWKTGQTTSYSSGDDGDLEKGVSWPVPRFTDHGDETITDNLTGLMWTKNANLAGAPKFWQEALDYVKSINSGAGLGGYHDWCLPNRKELFSLIDRSRNSPALPSGHPFQNVQSVFYWSSTTYAFSTGIAWFVGMWGGGVFYSGKYSDYFYVWPVRSGQGPLGYPDISVTPNPVPFGNVNVGGTSDQTVTIKNDGNANLVVGTITQPSQPFSKIQDNCSGQTIAPNSICTVIYRFAPTTSGNFSSNSNIPSNDPDENPAIVSLNGVGVVETVSIPNILTGPVSGTTGVSYSYSTGGSTSSLGHSVEYQFDWKGDGSELSPWGPAAQLKTWTVAGTYNVKARARCATHTSVISGWTSGLTVTISAGVIGTATRDLPDCYTPSVPLSVTITVTPSATTFVFGVYQVEETPPNGWTVSDINENGQWDNINNSIKWSFFDKNNRTLTYKTTPPSGETGTKTFSGRVIFGEFGEYVVTIGGDSTIEKCPPETVSIPNVPSGPTSGTTGISYSYTTGGSTSSYGHSVEYQFDWKGDGSDLSPWGSATQSKTWATPGTYNVRARARCATDTSVVSGWSSGLSTVISSSTASVHCDFNSDGKTDILWRNKSTGQNVVWFMDGTTYSNYAWLLEVTDLNWQIVGTGDFNGDGKTDVLWRNTSTGQNVVWLMDGVNYGGYAWLLEVADLSWEIVGIGDFNGDGKIDILWRNKGTGQNVVWFMDGATMSNWSWILPEVPDTNWQIVGTGDFNGDGKTDILWRNKATGQNVVWFMDGVAYGSYAWLLEVTDLNWEIVGTGDFNGDGKTDILWRNKSTGQNVVWLMNGTALSSYTWLPDVPDTNWEIVGPK